MIEGMNHFTITAQDRARTLDFYVGLLGLREGHRPELGFPGAWLYGGVPQAVPHIYWDRPLPAQRTGVIDHLAFTARDLAAGKARFDERGVAYTPAPPGGIGNVAAVQRRPQRCQGRARLRRRRDYVGTATEPCRQLARTTPASARPKAPIWAPLNCSPRTNTPTAAALTGRNTVKTPAEEAATC